MSAPFPEQLPLDDGVLDLRVGSIDRSTGRVALTTRELAMLRYLAARPDEAVPRERLLIDVWEYAPGVESRTVDTTVKRLRKKLEQDPKAPRHLVSVHGVGYRLVPAASAPLATAEVPDLPEDADAFVGRGEELARLVDAAQGDRQLVTLRGPGGVGKSRLARELARMRAAEGDAVVPVDLSAAVTEDDVRGEVNAALGLPASSGDGELLEALSARVPALVLLDQADRCLPALRAWMPRLARGAPSSTAVVTARQLVGVPMELEIRVDPLPTAHAARLFEARAEHSGDRADVERLVEALDGLPLAIELAAGRASVLSPAEILSRLDQRFRLLAERRGGRRLDDTISWSWEALDDEERHALTACSVFRGGFDLPAAEAVVGAVIGEWVLDVVDALEARSLLQRQQRAGASRFFLLESVRSFAEGAGDVDVLARAAAAHRAWALARAARLNEAVDGPQAPAAIGALRTEAANLRSAWSSAPPGTDRAELAVVLAGLQEHTGSAAVGLEIVDTTLADDAELPSLVLGRLRLARARLLRAANDVVAARAEAAAAWDAADAAGAEGHSLLAPAAGLLADIDAETGDPQPARECLEDALERLPDDRSHARLQLLHKYGVILFHQGRIDDAEEVANRLFSHARTTGRHLVEGDARRLLGSILLRRSRMKESWAQAEAALALFQEAGHQSREALTLELMGVHAAFNRRFQLSAKYGREALVIYRRLGRRHELPRALSNLSRVLLHLGELPEARRLAEDAAALAREQGILRQELAAGTLLGTVALSEERWDDAIERYKQAVEQAGLATFEVGVAAAFACTGIAYLCSGRLEQAREYTELALAKYVDAGDLLGQAHHLGTLAIIQAEQDAPDAAEETLSKARDIAPKGEATPTVWLLVCDAFTAAAHLRRGPDPAQDARIQALFDAPRSDAFSDAMIKKLRARLG